MGIVHRDLKVSLLRRDSNITAQSGLQLASYLSDRPSCLCSQRICCITVWTKTPKLWSVTLDCQRSRELAVSCPQPAVLLDMWVRHLFLWSARLSSPPPSLFYVSAALAVSADIPSSFIVLWEALSSTTESIASVSEVLSTCLTWPSRSHGITERSRLLESTLTAAPCCIFSTFAECVLRVFHSSRGARSEAVQQSSGLLVHRSYILYSVSLSSFITEKCVKGSFSSTEYHPISLPQVMWISSVLRWKWCQVIWADSESRVWIWLSILGWHLRFRYYQLLKISAADPTVKISKSEWTITACTSLLFAAKDFICHLMEKDPLKRYTCEQALQHPW